MREMTNELGSSPLTRGKPPPPASSARAHPRSRGENCLAVCQSFQYTGSSPLTCNATPTTWDHPRSRGENVLGGPRSGSSRGSSPLTRGKREAGEGCGPGPGIIPAHAGKTHTQPKGTKHGIIPAHAGKTLRPWWRRGSRGDHPRSRGENVIGTFVAGFQAGSSPLTRGKRLRTG